MQRQLGFSDVKEKKDKPGKSKKKAGDVVMSASMSPDKSMRAKTPSKKSDYSPNV